MQWNISTTNWFLITWMLILYIKNILFLNSRWFIRCISQSRCPEFFTSWYKRFEEYSHSGCIWKSLPQLTLVVNILIIKEFFAVRTGTVLEPPRLSSWTDDRSSTEWSIMEFSRTISEPLSTRRPHPHEPTKESRGVELTRQQAQKKISPCGHSLYKHMNYMTCHHQEMLQRSWCILLDWFAPIKNISSLVY